MFFRKLLARLGSSNASKSQPKRRRSKIARRPRIETLTQRQMLAADIGAIDGVVFADLSGNGLTGDDTLVAGVQIRVFQDGGDATFGGTNPGTDDTLVGTLTTDANGAYRIEDLEPGTYFVERDALATLIPTPIQVETVTITDAQSEGVSGTVLDTFDGTAQAARDPVNATVPSSQSSAAANEAFGGFRDLLVNRTSVLGDITATIDDPSEPDSLAIASSTSAEGSVTLQYDGNDGDPTTIDFTGLGGLDLSNGGLTEAISLLIQSDQPNGTAVINVYTDAANFSTATVNIPQVTGGATPDEQFVRLPGTATASSINTFATAGGTGADFSNVGAIEVVITGGVTGADVTFSLLEGREDSSQTANFSTSQPLTLGNLIFQDANNNGVFDGTDTGIQGVDVIVFRDNGDSTFDPATDTQVGTATTDANGAWTVPSLLPGDYFVQIPQSEFAAAGPLFGFTSSTGGSSEPAVDPDNNVDDDDNGTVTTVGGTAVGVVSGAITLVSGDEPINDGDTDANTNLTVDFGFFPQIDVAVTKVLLDNAGNPVDLTNAAANDLANGTEATFRITYTNNGPTDATGVTVTETLPAELTFVQTNNLPAGVTESVNGNVITYTIGNLAASASAQFEIVASISQSAAATQTNSVTITANENETDTTNNTATATVDPFRDTDLSITKTDNVEPATAGGQLIYTLTATNNGPSDATGVTVVDTLPTGVTFVSGTINGSSVGITEANGVVSANVGTLLNGASATIVLTVNVASDAPDTLNNTATVSNTPDTDNNPNNDSATEPATVRRNVDLTLDKSVTGTTFSPGGTATYQIVVTNNGPAEARGITVTDTLDNNLTFGSLTSGTGVSVSQSNQDLTFTLANPLASGQSLTFTFDVTIANTATGTIPNSATVATTDTETDATNNSDDQPITVTPIIDLAITKDDGIAAGASATPGNSLTYTLVVTNNGPSDASNVVVTDNLPSGFTATSVSAPGGTSSQTNNTVTVNYASLASGASQTIMITGTIGADQTTSLVNPASVTATETESDTTNNDASVTTPLAPDFDVSITKTDNGVTATPGQNLTYQLTISNDGPSVATNVGVTDVLPAGLSFVSGTINGNSATFDAATRTVTYTVGNLDPSQSVTADLVVLVDTGTAGTISNTAQVTTDTGDNDPSNNSSTDTTPLSPSVDLTITKSVDNTSVRAGDQLTYTINVTNSGPSTATGVTATDTLPAGLTFVSGTGPTGAALAATGQVINVDIGTLAAGATSSFTIIASVDTGASGNLVNQVSTATPLTETDTTNNTAMATTTVDTLTSSFGGNVYVDTNGNGVFDAGESPIVGVQLTLTGSDTLGNAITRTTTTDTAGAYLFDNLPEGTFTVTQTQPSGFQDGQETAGTGTTGGTTGNDVFSNQALAANTAATDFNFAEVPEPLSKRRFLASSL